MSSNKWALYHDHDPFKCEVVREAIKAKAIADGEVICGDIKELKSEDIMGFRQFHAFCGGGFWSLALRQAGWPDDREAWTGSCPCPSFSVAGKGEGFADPRHLWPEWYRLIRECRPGTIFGEQVAAAIGHGWLDLVCGDMEAEKYAIAQAVLGAHSAGAPHIRQRLYFCADSASSRRYDGGRLYGGCAQEGGGTKTPVWSGLRLKAEGSDTACIGANTDSEGLQKRESERGVQCQKMGREQREAVNRTGATRGFWSNCDWWYGRDGKYRPIEPGIQPLASRNSPNVGLVCSEGQPPVVYSPTEARVGRLRLYGDAICVPVATEFIRAYREVHDATI